MRANLLFHSAIALLALLSAGCVTVTVKEDHFFYPGPAENPSPLSADGDHIESLSLTTNDGVQLAGAYVRRPDAKYDVLYFGGNAARVDDYGRAVAREMSPIAANVVFFDYRGYGRSSGVPTIDRLKNDALTIFDHWAARATGHPIVLHGFSLGSFIAAYVAEKRPVAGLILESSAPDVSTWARNQIPSYAKPFVRLRIAPALLEESNAERLRSYAGPLLLITGDADPVTPLRFANALAAASRSDAITVVVVPGATHGNGMSSDLALRAYAEFLASISAGRGRSARSVGPK